MFDLAAVMDARHPIAAEISREPVVHELTRSLFSPKSWTKSQAFFVCKKTKKQTAKISTADVPAQDYSSADPESTGLLAPYSLCSRFSTTRFRPCPT